MLIVYLIDIHQCRTFIRLENKENNMFTLGPQCCLYQGFVSAESYWLHATVTEPCDEPGVSVVVIVVHVLGGHNADGHLPKKCLINLVLNITGWF